MILEMSCRGAAAGVVVIRKAQVSSEELLKGENPLRRRSHQRGRESKFRAR